MIKTQSLPSRAYAPVQELEAGGLYNNKMFFHGGDMRTEIKESPVRLSKVPCELGFERQSLVKTQGGDER